jgi:hypothetical protein
LDIRIMVLWDVTAWFGRCAPQLWSNVFLSLCFEERDGAILTKQTSTISRDCIMWQHRMW